MNVYVDKMPDSCADCPCDNDYYCGALGKDFFEICEEVDVCEERMGCCPLIELIHCKNCKWYDPPHIEYKDGTREDYPKEPFVTADIGVTVGGICIAKNKIYCTAHDRENPDDYEEIVMFRNPDDYCSYGERKDERSKE